MGREVRKGGDRRGGVILWVARLGEEVLEDGP